MAVFWDLIFVLDLLLDLPTRSHRPRVKMIRSVLISDQRQPRLRVRVEAVVCVMLTWTLLALQFGQRREDACVMGPPYAIVFYLCAWA